MARLKRRRSRRRGSRNVTSGWLWLLAGLAVGLGLAVVLYLGGAPPQRPVQAPAPQPLPAPTTPAPAVTPPAEQPDPERERFQFYDMLPRFEVVVPQPGQPRDAPLPPTERTPGQYLLQAGSFRQHADAERTRAQLALIGITARIEQVTVDDVAYHRVRIGPVTGIEEAERLRSRMRQENIEVMVLRARDQP